MNLHVSKVLLLHVGRCGHCKKLAPEFEKLSTSPVDCDEHKSLCSKYGVSGYPHNPMVSQRVDLHNKKGECCTLLFFLQLSFFNKEGIKGKTAQRNGKIYLKAAKNSVQKGADYANKEVQRLGRMLDKSISQVKADEFTLKKNILSTFDSFDE